MKTVILEKTYRVLLVGHDARLLSHDEVPEAVEELLLFEELQRTHDKRTVLPI